MKTSGVFIAIVITLLMQNVASNTITRAKEERYVETFTREIDTLARSGIETDTLKKYLAELALPSVMRTAELSDYIEQKSTFTCSLCRSLVNVIMNYRKEGMDEDNIISLVTNLCTSLNIQTETVCKGIIQLNAPIALYIIDNKSDLSADTVCGLVLRSSSCPLTSEDFEWTIEVDDGAPKYITSDRTDETINVVQLSDFHYDPEYEAYGNSYCTEPTCCRRGQNRTNTNNKVAGFWGDYNDCDSPWHAIVDVLDQIKNKEQDITYIYFTGDIVDHGIWETTRAHNIESIARTYATLYEKFSDMEIYPIIGNHEPNPTNVFAPADVTDDKVSTTWLYEMLANIWIDFGWLPESTRSTILQGGFYTVSPKKGFRIIALNNNICYVYNWWLLYEPQDPSGQLQWLAETLLQAETDGEYVHILSHAPPGSSSCVHSWGTEYRRIMNRFAHIVQAEFSGHTHNDEFRLIYDLENTTEAIRVAWNGGSVSTYSNLNPNYKIYAINTGTYMVEDIETWMYNLTLANESPDDSPVWFKSYSFKEEYELENLSPSSLNNLIIRMATNSSVLSTYWRNYVKQTDPMLSTGCDDSCLANQLCTIVTAVGGDSTQCEYFTNLA